MRFSPTPVDGAMVVDLDEITDERGGFARWYCDEEMAGAGLEPLGTQINTSWNAAAGTLRGLHWQEPPHGEAKLLRCVAGEVFDVCVDTRPGSATLGAHVGVHLTAGNRRGLFVPPGCAHGYLALTGGATVIYQTSVPYSPGAERGLRWDDPIIAIEWPAEVVELSEKDRSWPHLSSLADLGGSPA